MATMPIVTRAGSFQQQPVLVTTVTSETPSRRSNASSPGVTPARVSPLKAGQVQQAMQYVPTVHQQLQVMEDTIRALSQENAMLKEKMLKNRRGQLEKLFLSEGGFLVQACFGEWNRVYKEHKAARELDGLHSKAHQDREQFAHTAAELQQRIAELNALLNEARQDGAQKQYRLGQLNHFIEDKELENQGLNAKASQLEQDWHDVNAALARAREEEALRKEQLALVEKLIAQFMDMATGYKMKTNPTSGGITVPPNQQVAYIKDALHGILAETDAKYLAPISMQMVPTVGVNVATVGSLGSVTQTSASTGTAVAMEQPATTTLPSIGMPNMGGPYVVQKRTLPSVGAAPQVTQLMMSPRAISGE